MSYTQWGTSQALSFEQLSDANASDRRIVFNNPDFYKENGGTSEMHCGEQQQQSFIYIRIHSLQIQDAYQQSTEHKKPGSL